MDDQMRYLFDTRGVFTIPGALSLSHVRAACPTSLSGSRSES